ncbi:terminase large subunit domain-containing protein [Parasphingorhabdus sp.]|uniref:terminase large subunit domain-containing protein n=1 Tax=Parasphingorhabdus sp. TaxID=2709688 RepID=UPI002F9529E8
MNRPAQIDQKTDIDAAPAPPVNVFDRANRDDRREARSLYWRGWSVTEIADELSIKRTTVSSWKTRDKWDNSAPLTIIEDRIEARIAAYIDKPDFNEGDMKRVDFLMRQLERGARIRKYEETGKEADLNPKINARNDEKAEAKRAEKRKNFLTDEQWDLLEADFHEKNFGHQNIWWEQRDQRTRKILKSRQTGATWYFAREAMMKIREGYLNGNARNQIFLSASKRQVLIFRRYIVAWVKKVTGVDLKGDPIMIDLGEGHEPVGLYFLSTNAQTAQGEHGDFYFDEFFWVHGFAELNKVAAAMATHKMYKRTYFSTPSTITHEAYAFWSGEQWNKGKAKGKQKRFDVSKRALSAGAIMPDGSWCQILTLADAIKGGMSEFFDEEELRAELSEEEFANLYECEFIDDSASSFPYSMINPARVDSFYKWRDFLPAAPRPFGNHPVWIGYDPNKNGRDDAALAILAPPKSAGGKFRVLEKLRLNGLDFQGQADAIKKAAARYNVTDISIDTTGAGQAVFELVKQWFPTTRRIEYSVAVKTALVLKAQNIFRNNRIEFDSGWSDVSASFMAIRPTVTGGNKVTYTANRNGQIGHADIAWAIMHALSNEPMNAALAGSGGGTVTFLD